jgi:hypothetical protein
MARSSIFISASDFCTGRRVNVDAVASAVFMGAGMLLFAWKNGYCSAFETVGRCCGSYSMRSYHRETPQGVIETFWTSQKTDTEHTHEHTGNEGYYLHQSNSLRRRVGDQL